MAQDFAEWTSLRGSSLSPEPRLWPYFLSLFLLKKNFKAGLTNHLRVMSWVPSVYGPADTRPDRCLPLNSFIVSLLVSENGP